MDGLDLEAIKQRAHVRATWPVGEIGNPQAWCRYCGAVIPGEHAVDSPQRALPGAPSPDRA
jgi:hypothetical protein